MINKHIEKFQIFLSSISKYIAKYFEVFLCDIFGHQDVDFEFYLSYVNIHLSIFVRKKWFIPV